MKSLQAEIARRARVSQSTVSRALRNHPGLPVETRRRIQVLARQLGYEVNPLLSAVLSSVRRSHSRRHLGTLAFLTAHATADGWKKIASYRDFFRGAQARAAEQGFLLEPHWAAAPGLSGERLSEILHTRGILGVLLATRAADGTFPELAWEKFSLVRIGLSQREPRLHCVVNHQARTARLVATELAARGCRRIGLAITTWQNEVVDQGWLSGFLAWQHAQPAAARVTPHVPTTLEPKPLLDWLRRARADAVISVNPDVPGWLREAGLAAPRQVASALLDRHDQYGDIAGADQNNELVGAAAVDTLISELRHNERGIPAHPRTTMIDSTWRDGATVPPRLPTAAKNTA